MLRLRPRAVPVSVIAWPVAVCSLALSVVALVLHARTEGGLRDTTDLHLADLWLAVLGPTVGAALVARDRRTGLVLLGTAPIAVGAAGGAYAVWAAEVGGAPGATAAAWLATWTWVPYFLPVLMLPVVFRADARLARLAGPVAGVLVLIALLCAFAPGPAGAFAAVPNPLGIARAPWLGPASGVVIGLTAVVLVPAAAVLAFVRRRRADGDDRWQLGMLAVGEAAFVAAHLSPVTEQPLADLLVAVGATALLASVALAVHLRGVTAGLRRERELLATAREAERLRLHRDLHDGVGPELAGIALQLGAFASTGDEPVLRDLETRLRGAVAEIRRVVDDLRPAGLDAAGLVGALRDRAGTFSAGDLDCEVVADVPDALPPAVEVAAYRIATEALTNAARHAGARTCVVRLSADPRTLVVEVEDDGGGIAADPVPGVGLPSMRRRAEELGGTLRIGPGAAGGTLVRATLPVV
ncbi:sensor histidine kinase [Pseudonocardia nematodicida]|uniref:histidine kinase n=1 Tax=Pseudonocardia nematodicida TaxID=1206997 RepID=A0ABV1KJC9_9PSEU